MYGGDETCRHVADDLEWGKADETFVYLNIHVASKKIALRRVW
jgi:hypothetical protein